MLKMASCVMECFSSESSASWRASIRAARRSWLMVALALEGHVDHPLWVDQDIQTQLQIARDQAHHAIAGGIPALEGTACGSGVRWTLILHQIAPREALQVEMV